MQSTIPFHGFYNSIHDAYFDAALVESETYFDDVDWSRVFHAYAAEFAGEFLRRIKVQGQFESLESPREYNFSTDRIFVDIPANEVRRMLAEVDPETLSRVAAERHTSRPGFLSYYSPRVESWGPVDDWDCNQTGTLVQAYAEYKGEIDIDYSIAEALATSGVVDDLIQA